MMLGLALALAVCILLILDHELPPPLDRAYRTSVLVLDGRDRLLRGFTVANGVWRLPARPEEVEPLYLRMLLAYEDQRFVATKTSASSPIPVSIPWRSRERWANGCGMAEWYQALRP